MQTAPRGERAAHEDREVWKCAPDRSACRRVTRERNAVAKWVGLGHAGHVVVEKCIEHMALEPGADVAAGNIDASLVDRDVRKRRIADDRIVLDDVGNACRVATGVNREYRMKLELKLGRDGTA